MSNIGILPPPVQPASNMTRIVAIEDDDGAIERMLEENLYAFNAAATGIADGERLTFVTRNEAGTIVGAANGHTWGGCCELKQLWVEDGNRGQRIGSELVRAVEEEANRRGCRQIVLSTHSFQAPGFYERLGFSRLASIPEYPQGYENILYLKRLTPREDPDAGIT